MSPLLTTYFTAGTIHHHINLFEQRSYQQTAARGPFPCNKHDAVFSRSMAALRWQIAREINRLRGEDAAHLCHMENIHTASGRMRGAMFGQALRKDEAKFIKRQEKIFRRNWRHPDAFKAFTILSFYTQPFEVPLQNNIGKLTAEELQRYLHFVLRQPHIMEEENERQYAVYYQELIRWLLNLMRQSKRWPHDRLLILRKVIQGALTFGACYYVDRPTGPLVRLRARIVKALTSSNSHFKQLKVFPRPAAPAPGRRKLRLGILSRNNGDYTDTRALYAMFQEFDPARYEIYWYSLDIIDPTTLSDVKFFRDLYGFIHKAVSLRGNATVRAQQILDDDLDILAVGTAFSFGAQDLDQMLSCRLARVQVGLNAMVPGSSGFASYDYMVVPKADAAAMKNFRAEATEKFKVIGDPMIWYEPRPATRPNGDITRAALGIPEDAVVYCSGAAANKQMPGTMETWLKILQRVPNSYLLMYPFNPAWGGYFIGLTFLARLNMLLERYPDIDPKRVVVTRQVTPDEGNRLLLLSDVYLGSFPHAGATSVMLALQHGKPVIARRARWLRSTTDPSMVGSLGLHELIGKDNAAFTKIGIKLGNDAAYRKAITARVVKAAAKAPFFDHRGGSKRLQALFDAMAAEKGLLPRARKAEQKPKLRLVAGR